MYKSREFREFRENAERISQITQTIFNENFSFRTHFRWLNEIFAKEIERTFLKTIKLKPVKKIPVYVLPENKKIK